VDKFIHYILENSKVKDRNLLFPTDILAFPIGIKQSRFIGLEPWRKPPPPISREPFKMTNTKREKAFESSINRLEIQKKASLLLKEFDAELIAKGELRLSSYFSKILDNNWNNFKLAVKFSYYN
jgi:hypothetical protein